MPNFLLITKRHPLLFIFSIISYFAFGQDTIVPPAEPVPGQTTIIVQPPAPATVIPPPPQPVYRSSGSDVFDRVRFGAHFDPTVSFLGSRDNQIDRTGNRLGMMTGLCMELYFAPRVALTSGVDLTFSTGGPLSYPEGGDILHESDLSDDKYHDLPPGVEVRYGINFFSIPLGLKMRTQEFGNKRFWVEFPILTHSFRMRANADIQNTTDRNVKKENIEADIRLFNLFLGGAIGIEIPLGTETDLILGLRYSQSLFDMIGDKGTQPGPDFKKYDDKDNLGLLSLKVGIMF